LIDNPISRSNKANVRKDGYREIAYIAATLNAYPKYLLAGKVQATW